MVVARIYDPGRAEVYQRLGITTVATVKWTADQVLRRLLPVGAEPDFRDPSGTVRVDAVHGQRALDRPAHGASSRSSPGAASPGSTGSARACCRPADSVLQEDDMLHLVMREENAERVFDVFERGPEDD